MKNIFITGTYGFIGSHFLKLLVDHKYEPIGLGRRTLVGEKRRIEDIDKNKYKDYEGDICNRRLIEEIIIDNDIDCIVNFSAHTMVDRSIRNSEPFIYSNYIGTWNLLETIRKNKENGKDIRMVQISTDECYGSILEGSFKETDKLSPGNPYSGSKSSADLLCISHANTYDIDVAITRSSNNYGPFQHPEKYIPRMIDLAINKKPLEVYGNGTNIRDWLYVTDNCKAIKLVMEKGKKGEIYNIGTNNEMSNNHVAKIIADRFKVPIRYIEDRKGHDFRYSTDCTKIKDELGWKPVTKFEDGLEKTIDWYIKEEYKKDLEATKGLIKI